MKDLRKITNRDMASYGKVVEVVWSSGYDCDVRFPKGKKVYRMSRLSLDRLSEEEYNVHNHAFDDEVSDAGSLDNTEEC